MRIRRFSAPAHAAPLYIYVLALAFAVGAATSVRAQEQLALRQAVAEAIAHNQQLQAARFEIHAAESDKITAGLRPNPTLTLNADMLPSNGLGPLDKNYGASVNFPLELGGKRDARLKTSEAELQAAEHWFADETRQTTAAVRAAYFDLLGASEKARVAVENLALLDSLVALSRVRVADRDIAAVELTRSEVERERFGLDVVRAREEERSARTTLRMLMGRPTNGRAAVGEDALSVDSGVFSTIAAYAASELMPLDTVLALAEADRPDILALRAQEDAAEAGVELQRAMAKVDLNVSLDFTRSQGVTFYGSTLSVPLPISNQNQGEIAKAEARLEQSHVATQAALTALRADVTNAWYDARTKQQAFRTLATSVLQKASSVRSAIEYSYRRGGTSLVDFLDAARTYNELEQAYADAMEAYAKSLVTLDLATGKDLYYAN